MRQEAYLLFYQCTHPFPLPNMVYADYQPVVSSITKGPKRKKKNKKSSQAESCQINSSQIRSDLTETKVDNGESKAEGDPQEENDEPVLCVGGCGFYGRKSTQNMCSQCYEKSTGLRVANDSIRSSKRDPPRQQFDSSDHLLLQIQELLRNQMTLEPANQTPNSTYSESSHVNGRQNIPKVCFSSLSLVC